MSVSGESVSVSVSRRRGMRAYLHIMNFVAIYQLASDVLKRVKMEGDIAKFGPPRIYRDHHLAYSQKSQVGQTFMHNCAPYRTKRNVTTAFTYNVDNSSFNCSSKSEPFPNQVNTALYYSMNES